MITQNVISWKVFISVLQSLSRSNSFFVLFIDLFEYPFTSFHFFFSVHISIAGDTNNSSRFWLHLFKLLRTILLTKVSGSKIGFSIRRLRNFNFRMWLLTRVIERVQVVGYFQFLLNERLNGAVKSAGLGTF